MSQPKIIAMYLPQFHHIPENDEFWGKGFTDWVTVKKAKPLFKGHQQPKIPFNNNYYDLSIKRNVLWQAELAQKYGVYGFGVYHYWFNNEKNLLTKPAEILREINEVETHYFFVWDNASWKRSWSNLYGNDWAPLEEVNNAEKSGPQILIPYILGEEKDWRNHYEVLLPHFKSENYIKVDNKPVFSLIDSRGDIPAMCKCWDNWAREDGYDGIFFIFKNSKDLRADVYKYNYQPHHAAWINISFIEKAYKKLLRIFGFHVDLYYDYDIIWKRLLKYAMNHPEKELFHGGFVAYDDSPRRGIKKAKVVRGGNPTKFGKYLKQLVDISKKQNKEFVFLTAWNEWGEGAYLEPDALTTYSYLDEIKKIFD